MRNESPDEQHARYTQIAKNARMGPESLASPHNNRGHRGNENCINTYCRDLLHPVDRISTDKENKETGQTNQRKGGKNKVAQKIKKTKPMNAEREQKQSSSGGRNPLKNQKRGNGHQT